MNKTKNTVKKKTGGKLLKITIREKSKNQVLMELLPTRANIVKARNMAYMADIEVINVYSE